MPLSTTAAGPRDEQPDGPQQPAGRRSPRRRLLLWGLVVVLVLAVGVLLQRAEGRSSGAAAGVTTAGNGVIQQYPVSQRKPVERFEALLLDGSAYDSAATTAPVTVYNVWGSWCGPCRVEAPALRRVALETAAEGAVFVGINVRDGLDAARAFERALEVPYPSIRADDSASALLAFGASAGMTAVPTTIVLDAEGRIAARVVGEASYGTLKALVGDVLAESGPTAS